MKKIIVLVFVIFLFLVTLKSQNPISSKHQHFIGISSGISQMLIQDETVSPFIYEGVRIPLEISYRYNSPSCRQLLFVNYFSSTLTSLISNKLNNLNYYEENQNLSIQYYRLSTGMEVDANLINYQGKGIPPNISVQTSFEDSIKGIDRILEKGIEIIAKSK